jgi:two-component system, chemotaxis family, protein-glutamate methylesterase/glutaminase
MASGQRPKRPATRRSRRRRPTSQRAKPDAAVGGLRATSKHARPRDDPGGELASPVDPVSPIAELTRPAHGERKPGARGDRPVRRPARATTKLVRDFVVLGASGGGVEALSHIVHGLPPTLPAAVAAVLHRAETGPNVLVTILARAGGLVAREASDGMSIENGHLYLPPLDHHMLVEDGRFRLSRGPKENYVRPAIDPLFRSAARNFGPRTIGVILTGSLDDGTAGLLAIKRRGGLAIVQDPDDAMFPGMPRSAVEHVQVDYCVALSEIPELIADLAGSEVLVTVDPLVGIPTAAGRQAGFRTPGGGPVTIIACPICKGALKEIQDGDVVRFRCHTGHGFGFESLIAGKEDDVEAALWAALRALHERAELLRRMGRRARDRGDMVVAGRHDRRTTDLEAQIRTLRQLIERM